MKCVDEIVAAVRRLDPTQFRILRRKLERLKEKMWQIEQLQVTETPKNRGITDHDIDRMVLRRRRENRR